MFANNWIALLYSCVLLGQEDCIFLSFIIPCQQIGQFGLFLIRNFLGKYPGI